MALITAGDATVRVTVQTRVDVAPARAFAVVAPIDLTLIFTGFGPLPAVTAVRDQTGSWDAVGQSRSPQLSDGTSATERLTEYAPPHSFAYEVTGFSNSLRRLVEGARGEWTFTPDGAGAVIRWTYEFKPLPYRKALVRRVLAPAWRPYMRRALAAAASIAQAADGSSSSVSSSGTPPT
jgi:Polyketide cyclase / dehydrase and lipid transport